MSPLTLAETFFLVSPWKPVLFLPPFLVWAWMISKIFDKHAARFFLAREAWNAGHVLAGFVALALAFAIPVAAWWTFFASYVLVCGVLAADLMLYITLANKDERVPEAHRIQLDFSKLKEAQQAKKDAKQAATVQLGIQGPDKIDIAPPNKDEPAYEIRAAAEEIYLKGMDTRATRTDIRPASKEAYAVSFLVDGVRQPGDQIPVAQAIAIIDFWKSCAGLDTDDRRRELKGSVKVTRGEVPTKCRIVTRGGRAGMELSILYDPESQVQTAPKDLGMTDKQFKAFDDLKDKGGVVLLAGTPLGGRTTTLYGAIKLHDAYTQNVQTLEFEAETDLEGIRQVIYEPTGEDADYATQVRSILRRDPDVVAVADMVDEATAKESAAVDAAHSRVYLSMKADSALAAVQLYVRAVGDAQKAADTLRGVVAQRMMRKLCNNCKVAYPPTGEMLSKLGLPGDQVKQLYKKGGQVMIKNKPEVCPVCQGIGYVGQTGVFEVYPVSDDARELIAAQNWAGLRSEFKKSGLPNILNAAIRKLVAGETSVEELTRVTSPAKKKAPAKPKPKPKPEQN